MRSSHSVSRTSRMHTRSAHSTGQPEQDEDVPYDAAEAGTVISAVRIVSATAAEMDIKSLPYAVVIDADQSVRLCPRRRPEVEPDRCIDHNCAKQDTSVRREDAMLADGSSLTSSPRDLLRFFSGTLPSIAGASSRFSFAFSPHDGKLPAKLAITHISAYRMVRQKAKSVISNSQNAKCTDAVTSTCSRRVSSAPRKLPFATCVRASSRSKLRC